MLCILASAIHYQVDEFVTFDSRDVKKPSKAKRGILPLSRNVAGFRLQITKPVAQNSELALVLPIEGKKAEDKKDREREDAESPTPPG